MLSADHRYLARYHRRARKGSMRAAVADADRENNGVWSG
jgi:hypothetical protein